jgi:hypothetical protein
VPPPCVTQCGRTASQFWPFTPAPGTLSLRLPFPTLYSIPWCCSSLHSFLPPFQMSCVPDVCGVIHILTIPNLQSNCGPAVPLCVVRRGSLMHGGSSYLRPCSRMHIFLWVLILSPPSTSPNSVVSNPSWSNYLMVRSMKACRRHAKSMLVVQQLYCLLIFA